MALALGNLAWFWLQEEPFASIAPLQCSNQAGVYKWLEKMITHHAAGSVEAGAGAHSGAGEQPANLV